MTFWFWKACVISYGSWITFEINHYKYDKQNNIEWKWEETVMYDLNRMRVVYSSSYKK